MEIAFSPGVSIADLEATFAGDGAISIDGHPVAGGLFVQEREDLIAPIPSIGLFMQFYPFSKFFDNRLKAQIRGDFFWVEVSNYTGSMAEFYGGLEYRLFKYLGLGVALNRQTVDAEKETSNGWKVDNEWNNLYLYASIYPF